MTEKREISLSAVAETMMRGMEFWQGEALRRASQLDGLLPQLAAATKAIEEVAEREREAAQRETDAETGDDA